MFANQKTLLDQAITAVNSWRQQGQNIAGGPVEVNQVNFRFPDGQDIVFQWDEAHAQFKIIAQ